MQDRDKRPPVPPSVQKMLAIGWLFYQIGYVVCVSAVAYVVLHFVEKFW